MKRLYLLLAAAGLCMAVGTAARAQMGMDFFRKPAIASLFKPVIGNGALYESTSAGHKKLWRYSPVGSAWRMKWITSGLPTTRKLARPVNTSAFVGTNPTGELITSGLPVTRAQS